MKLTKTQLKRIIKEELGRVLGEGVVVVRNLPTPPARAEDYVGVEVTLDGDPVTTPEIFDQLNSHQEGEYEGWKNNINKYDWEDFYYDQFGSAIEIWAEEMGHDLRFVQEYDD